jgi:hypothetical protein
MLGESMHAHADGLADGLAFAIADNPAAAAGAVDTPRDLEIDQCATRQRLLVAAGFAMMLLSASLVFHSSLAFGWWDGLGGYDTAIGYAGVALFGLITCRLIVLLPAARGPVVIVTSYGIRDLRIGNEFLLWESIADVSAEDCRGHKVIVLTPTPALQRQLSCIHAAWRGAQADRIVIQSEGLTTDFETLLRACRDFHAAAESHTALRRDRDDHAQASTAQAQDLASQAS